MMRSILETFSRLVAAFRRRRLDRDFDEEFAAHVDLLAEQKEREGLPRDEARRQAILQMGGVNATKDLHREARGLPPVERLSEAVRTVGRDLIHATRSLAKARGFTFVCVASLGIGMGTVIAMLFFTRALFGPQPGVDPDGLVELLVVREGPLLAQAGDFGSEQWIYPDFQAVRDADTGVDIAGWTMGEGDIETPDSLAPIRVASMFVSANYFSTVGVTLARGPGFDSAVDDRPNGEPRVILAYDFWQNRLAADPDIVGAALTLDGVAHAVVGVAPDNFVGHLNPEESPRAQLFVPLGRHPHLTANRFNREVDWVRIVGRLSPNVRIEQANAAVSAVMSGLAAEYPATNEFKTATVEPYFSYGARARREIRLFQAGILGLSGMALLVVCLNISGMMLVRSALRERELSIRQAVGAGRAGLVRHLLSEAFLLAGLSGALAALVLLVVPAVLSWWYGFPLPPPLRPDLPVIAFSVGLCLVTSLMFGLLPAIRFSRPALISALKDGAGASGRRVGRVHRVAALVEVALVVPLLVLSGVALNQARETATADLGFDPGGLAAVRLDLPDTGDAEDQQFFLRNIRDDLELSSGIRSVTMADGLPLDFRRRYVRVARSDQADFALAHSTRAGDGYLDTMGIGLLSGRDLTADDAEGAPPVTIISEPLAARLFPDGNAIGERLRLSPLGSREERVVTIVGVTADFVTSQVGTPRPQILLPLAQLAEGLPPSVFLVVRGTFGTEMPTLPTAAFETAIRDFDPVFFPSRIVTGEQLVRNSVRDFIGQSTVAVGVSTVVLVLAALGVCGVVGFMVATRTREIAVRIALGASRRRVVGMVLADVVRLILPGIAGGLLLSAAVVRTTLFSFYPYTIVESVVYTVAVAIVILVALFSSLPAARRAASVEPMVAMRAE
jgi:predicted permease